MGGIFFLWAPLNFDDLCLHYQLFDDNVGRPLFQVGARLPVYGSPDELPGSRTRRWSTCAISNTR